VNSTLWFFMKWEDILGSIQLRHHIDHPMLREAGWHIGYGIRPSARGMWYAKEMLYLWLAEAKNMWIDVVKLSADEDNPASWKTIERCGGVFYKTLIKDNIPLKFYHIHTSI
jgi:predicted acetyltransferase